MIKLHTIWIIKIKKPKKSTINPKVHTVAKYTQEKHNFNLGLTLFSAKIINMLEYVIWIGN